MSQIKAILVAVDGSANSDRAVTALPSTWWRRFRPEVHLLNVQPSLRGAIATFVSREQINSYHREEGNKALASAVELAGKASVPAQVHIGVGRQGEVIRDFAKKLGAKMVVMGTRGHTGLSGVLLGSVAQDVIAHVDVPVTLVK